MILNRNLLSINDPQEDFVRSEVEGIIDRSNASFTGFSNDFYKIVQNSLERIRRILHHYWIGVEPHWIRTPDELNEFFNNLKQINGLNNLRAIRLKDHIKFLAENTESVSSILGKQLATLEPLMAAAEGAITNTTTNSIREENYISTVFNNQDSVSLNTLTINTDEGAMTVPFIESVSIPIVPLTDASLTINGNPLAIRDGDNRLIQTEKLFTSGYYFGKFLDLNPTFLSRPQISSLSSNDNTTFYVESYDDKTMKATLSFLFLNPAQNIGTMHIEFGKCSDFPRIEQLLVKKTGEATFEDITAKCFSKGLKFRGTTPQTDNQTLKPGQNKQYATMKVLVNEKNVQEVKVVISISNSEEVEYQEYNLLNAEDSVSRIFNYFESLYISDFSFGGELTIAKAGIDTQDIERALTTGKTVPNKKTIRKRYLSIRAMDFNSIQSTSKGEYESIFYGRGNEIQSVEMLANEYIPDGLSTRAIRYYISTDGVAFTEIWPGNRQPTKDVKARLIFDPRDKDREPVPSTGRVRLKIQIDNGNTGLTPKVYGFLLRIKETFGI
jgi:hypothetical protein